MPVQRYPLQIRGAYNFLPLHSFEAGTSVGTSYGMYNVPTRLKQYRHTANKSTVRAPVLVQPYKRARNKKLLCTLQ